MSKPMDYEGLPRETHRGVLKLGSAEIECVVLDDGSRVITGDGTSYLPGSTGVDESHSASARDEASQRAVMRGGSIPPPGATYPKETE